MTRRPGYQLALAPGRPFPFARYFLSDLRILFLARTFFLLFVRTNDALCAGISESMHMLRLSPALRICEFCVFAARCLFSCEERRYYYSALSPISSWEGRWRNFPRAICFPSHPSTLLFSGKRGGCISRRCDGKSRREKTGKDKTGQDRTREDKTRQVKTRPDKTRLDKTR